MTLHIVKPPEGVYLASSDESQGLVAQGCTIQETAKIGRDVAWHWLLLLSGRIKAMAPVRRVAG